MLKLIFTKVGFGNGEHCFAIITNLSLSHWALAWTRLATSWSFHLCTTMASPKIRMFILTWSWCWGPLLKVENFLGLAFFAVKPCTSFKCLVNNHLAEHATMQVPILHFHFDPTFHPFLVLLNHIRWTRGCRWQRGLVDFKFWT